MKVVKQIDIYLERKRNVKVIDVVQYDKANQLVFTVKDFTIPTGTTGTLYVQKPSGKFVYQEDGITIADNTITINLENQAITEHGKVPYQVTLKNGSDDITTFEGLMMVQRSLKDSGAVESTTVIRAFDNAVNERVAAFRTQAETIAAGVIATIPEDYTAMAAKVNQLANAIKGKLSGYVVKADDVSPVEHEMDVWVHGKNLFDVSKVPVQESTDNIYISAVGEGYIDITTKEPYDGNGHCVTWVKLKELCPQMKPGKQYALSGTTTAWNKMIYLKEMDLFWSYGTRNVVTEEMLECTIGFYGFNVIREQGFGTCRISNIQCEEGYDITDYEPYIDPTTVNVRRCGKNILKPKNNNGAGYTATVNGDGSVTVTGSANTTNGIYLTLATPTENNPLHLIKGQAYKMQSWSNNDKNINLKLMNDEGQAAWTSPSNLELYLGNGYSKIAQVYVESTGHEVGDTSLCGTYKFMIEVGNIETDFEAFTETEYIPSSDGTVEGVTSLSPNMTILTDTENVIVECEYIKDTNKVIEKIANALGITV